MLCNSKANLWEALLCSDGELFQGLNVLLSCLLLHRTRTLWPEKILKMQISWGSEMTASSCSRSSVGHSFTLFFFAFTVIVFLSFIFLISIPILILLGLNLSYLQWHSCSTGSGSSCLSVWPPRQLDATAQFRALDSPSSNGSSLSGYKMQTAESHSSDSNPLNWVSCMHKYSTDAFSVVVSSLDHNYSLNNLLFIWFLRSFEWNRLRSCLF